MIIGKNAAAILGIDINQPIEPQMDSRTQIFEAKQKAMSDDELAEKCSNLVSNLCQKGDRAFTMSIPPSVDDSDMLLCELLNRFNKYRQHDDAINSNTVNKEEVK